MEEPTEAQIKSCRRYGATRRDSVDSDICGNCADDLRMEQEVQEREANADIGTD